MKNVMTSLVVLMTMLGFSQTKSMNDMVVEKTTKLENVAITVTVDSANDVEQAIKIEDIKKIIASSDENETLSFKIICNGETMSNGKKSHMSYKIEGNSKEDGKFIKAVEKIRKAAIKFYNNKN